MMIFEQIPVGNDNFAYLVADSRSNQAALVDPAFEPEKVLKNARKKDLEIKFLINTHSHYDHTGGNDYILKSTGTQLAGYGLTKPALSVKDGDVLTLGKLGLNIIYTPGHTPDSICILVQNKLITGDTLFVGTIGKTGFGKDAENMFLTLKKRILPLEDNIEVFPGHNYGSFFQSTIGKEKKINPFLKVDSFASFLDLKRKRAAGS